MPHRSAGNRRFSLLFARGARAVFPPEQVAEVKAIACELPALHGLPLGRFTCTELHRLVIERELTKDVIPAGRRRAATGSTRPPLAGRAAPAGTDTAPAGKER